MSLLERAGGRYRIYRLERKDAEQVANSHAAKDC